MDINLIKQNISAILAGLVYVPQMEFEEFMVLFGGWYSGYGKYLQLRDRKRKLTEREVKPRAVKGKRQELRVSNV